MTADEPISIETFCGIQRRYPNVKTITLKISLQDLTNLTAAMPPDLFDHVGLILPHITQASGVPEVVAWIGRLRSFECIGGPLLKDLPLLPMGQKSSFHVHSLEITPAFDVSQLGHCRNFKFDVLRCLAVLDLSSVRLESLDILHAEQLVELTANTAALDVLYSNKLEHVRLTGPFSSVRLDWNMSLSKVTYTEPVDHASFIAIGTPELKIIGNNKGRVFRSYLVQSSTNVSDEVLLDPRFFEKAPPGVDSWDYYKWIGRLKVGSQAACGAYMARRIYPTSILHLILAARRRRMRHPPAEIFQLIFKEFLVADKM